jgi:hypothetical protein
MGGQSLLYKLPPGPPVGVEDRDAHHTSLPPLRPLCKREQRDIRPAFDRITSPLDCVQLH